MAMSLQLRPKHTTLLLLLRNPNLIHRFSSSSSSGGNNDGNNNNNNNNNDNNNISPPQSPMSSYFNEVKASLKQPPRRPFQSPLPDTPKPASSLEDIRNKLSSFRKSSDSPQNNNSSSSSSAKPVSFQELFNRNVIQKSENRTEVGTEKASLSFDSIRDSLRSLKMSPGFQNRNNNSKVLDPYSLKDFKDSLRTKPEDFSEMRSAIVSGGLENTTTTKAMPFRKGLKMDNGETKPTKPTGPTNQLIREYKYEDLGAKLRSFRPKVTDVSQNWFSLAELNERLKKLREVEEKQMEMDPRQGNKGILFQEMRSSLARMTDDSEAKARKASLHRLDIMSHLGATPNFMLVPPKEHLVEKYFHPDNMSSAEKLKLELHKIREEFKLSESDCGSSRVQVAQLTVKIKHLSSVLHKKDKHSRKGLQEMVQRRKKILRYLRRTDWDNYCFCLSKLGLRDNPDYKRA